MERKGFLKALGLGATGAVIPIQQGYKITQKEYERFLKMNRKGVVLTEEHRKKISEGNKGKKLSEETKEKIRKANIGKTVSKETRRKLSEINTGKKISQEIRSKISLKSSLHRHSEETKRKIKESNIRTKVRPVRQFTLDGKFVAEWPSARAAGDALNTSYVNIWGSLNCKQNAAAGFIWKYKNTEDEDMSRFVISQYDKEGNFIRDWPNKRQACIALGLSRSTLTACLNKNIKSAGGFIWKYKNF